MKPPEFTPITFTAEEAEAIKSLGRKRVAHRTRTKGPQADFPDGGGTHEKRNEMGVLGEAALAKACGPDVYADWAATKAYTDGDPAAIPCDVGKNLHVRTTDRKGGRLILHPYDKPDTGVFVLCIWDEKARTASFVGWITAEEGKQNQYWDDRTPGFKNRPAYCVPQEDLYSMLIIPQGAIR